MASEGSCSPTSTSAPPLPAPSSHLSHPRQQHKYPSATAMAQNPPPVVQWKNSGNSRGDHLHHYHHRNHQHLLLPHHRLYDFAKSALIKIFASPYASVCDLYCGGGADIHKWDEAQIGHYIGIDASSSGINDARENWESSQRKPYTTDFFEIDPSIENLESYTRDNHNGIPADIVCCMQHLQLCFHNEERAKLLLYNVSSLLKPGGFFFGITPDSSTIWTKYQKIVEAMHNKGSSQRPSNLPISIRSENYVITFETEEEKFPFFGKKYYLKFANDVTSETHSLVHFPSLIRLAREAGLEYIEIQNLTEFYDDSRAQFAGMLHGYSGNFLDPRGKLLPRASDILGLYATFIFQKPDPEAAPPLPTPRLPDRRNVHEEEGGISNWRLPVVGEEKKNVHIESITNLSSTNVANSDKGILGPGPADLRFTDIF
ncbi:mRNA cap guanine-N7 methyltransferase 2 [Zostera marina]|uniref:mRNA cap guanine-N(7) methyltransferase 2 n=1 Tax=Zostera marina TaxID=29655 RepID=A0A0K9NUB2_ZOSMR|nr:mRNA cap guanine-N7 methyltransferase 2 [Zostera marina]